MAKNSFWVFVSESPEKRRKLFYPILGFLVFLIVLFAGFNFALDKYGRFWEKEPAGLKIACPVPQEFCEQGRIIESGEAFYGLGFNLSQGAPLLAAFPGKVEDEPKISNHPLLYLRDSQGNEAIYSFYGTPSVSPGTQVSSGAEIAKIGEGSFPPVAPFIGLNVSFSLKTEGKYQKVLFQDFTKE